MGRYATVTARMLLGLTAVLGTVAGGGGGAAADEPPAAVRTGVELVGRSEDDAPPERWTLREKGTDKVVAPVEGRWGFAPAPPGTYALTVLPAGHQALQLTWGDVTVEQGRAARVELRSGLELAGRSAQEEPLEHWDVTDKSTGKQVARVWRRWGFTPLPPGSYVVTALPSGHSAQPIRWGEVTVIAGQTARLELRSGIEVAGRGEPDEILEHWDAIDEATGERVARTWRRWGFTPLVPGSYAVRILPQGQEAMDVFWSRVVVTEGAVTALKVASGITLTGRPGEEAPPKWLVVDPATNKPVALVHGRWGFTPLPAGTYTVVKTSLRLPTVEVKPDEVVLLEEADLATRLARVTGGGRKTEAERDPEAHRKLQEQIELVIRRAAAWLKTQERVTRMDPKSSDGNSTIGILALLHAGELERDPALGRRCRDFLLRRPLNGSDSTYATSITAMALRDLGVRRHRARVRDCATWLVENQGWGEARRVWGYGDPVPGFDTAGPVEDRSARPVRAPSGGRGGQEVLRRGVVSTPRSDWDNSNSQFAVLGLHAAAQWRIGIPRESWERVEAHFRQVQNKDGGWGYFAESARGSMTCAGLASLLIARHHLGAEQPGLDPAVVHGLEWLDWRFTVQENPFSGSNHYYYLYGLERVGVLAGTEFLGEHEWYPVGARYLLQEQRANGSWLSTKGPPAGSPPDYIDTCYAILFLRRATLPLATELPALLSVTHDDTQRRRDSAPAIELIFDSSGSMKDPVEGKPKIEIARAVLTEVLDGLSPDVQVGLRLYGHRGVWLDRSSNPQAPLLDRNDPRLKKDSELVVAIGPLDDARRAQIRRRIATTEPRGWTPMVHSLLEARKDFPAGSKAPRTVVLISDGEETGGGKLEDVAAAYSEAGIATTIHVVGFDIEGTEAERELREIARIGKGRFFGARNARELAKALRAVVPTLGFEVRDAHDVVVASGALNAEPIELKPGTYRVRLTGLESEPIEVTLDDGQEENLRVDTQGKLVPDGS